jgi:mono/diheme cytochrome c family protein
MSFLKAQFLPKLNGCGIAAAVVALLAFSTANVVTAQDKVIKKVPIQDVDAKSGQAMYQSYCAACHGATAKGDGPAASELKVPPTDLTQLTKNNHGEFPSAHLWAILQFGANAPAHGTSDMPVWGNLFRKLDPNQPVRVSQRVQNLVDYLKSLQAK